MIHFEAVDDTSLRDLVVDRELVNARIRQLQAVRHERYLEGRVAELADKMKSYRP